MRFHLVGQLFRGGSVSNPILFPDGTSSLPSISFFNQPSFGLWRAASTSLTLSNGGNNYLVFGSSGLIVASGLSVQWGSNGTGSTDLFLTRDAANTLAQRNGVNAQVHRIYNTYTDASNYERGVFQWNTNTLQIGTEAAGSGSSRDIRFVRGGTAVAIFDASNFVLEGGRGLRFVTDNVADIGALGANRPRAVYIGSSVNVAGRSGFGQNAIATALVGVGAGTAGVTQLNLASSVAPTSPNDGDIWFDGSNLHIRIGGATYTLDKTAV